MVRNLDAEFHQAMVGIYHAASELGYRPTYFLRTVNEYGGVEAAKRLLNTDETQTGLTKLWELGRLDLSAEALVLNARWTDLFTDDERRKARQRLLNHGYGPTQD